MPDADDHPIAYTALQPGTPVQTSNGQPFATVQSVLVDELVSVFDGIVVDTAEGPRFVDADEIDTIHTVYVRTTLSLQQAAALPPPSSSNLVEIKPTKSVFGRLGRRFRGGKR